MSIGCTLKRDQLVLRKINIFKTVFGPTKNSFILKVLSANIKAAVLLELVIFIDQEYKQHRLQHRRMVAEFLERQRSNSETPNQHHIILDLPNTPSSLHQSVATALQVIDYNNNSSLHNQPPQQQRDIHNHPVHMASTLPSTPHNVNTNLPLNSRNSDMLLSSQHEPLSPHSSDGGNSISEEHIHHMNSNSSSSSSSGKYGSGGASPNGSNGFYDMHMTKQQHQHKELFTQRKQREFIPDNKKDDSYWDRRRRNNEAAKRSREKRRYNDMVLEQRVVELTKENHVLKAQLDAIRDKFNITSENLISVEQIMASLPTSEQVLSITKRAKLNSDGVSTTVVGSGSILPTIIYDSSQHEAPLQKYFPAAEKDTIEYGVSQIKQNSPKFQSPNNESLGNFKLLSHTSHSMNADAHHPVQHYAHLDKGNQISSTISTNLVATGVEATCGTPQLSPALPKISAPFFEEASPQLFQHHQLEQFHNPLSHAKKNQMPQNLQATALQNLEVLKAFNRKIGDDDIDNLRKVVEVVGAMTANVTNSNANSPVAGSSEEFNAVNVIYQPTTQSSCAHTQHTYSYTSFNNTTTRPLSTPLNHNQVNHGQFHSPIHVATADAGSSAFTNGSPIYNETCSSVAASVLNLSRRTSIHNYELLFSSVTSPSLSSSVCSGVLSGDDEHESIETYNEAVDDHESEQDRMASTSVSRTVPITNLLAINASNNDGNNSLPLKLRHKSHLGDKDAAATALLALQHIKQEPMNNRSSPPLWGDNGDNSSDDRDSGISIGSSEWTSQFPRKIIGKNAITAAKCSKRTTSTCSMPAERDQLLKSQLAKLESEAANIRSMIILRGSTTPLPPVVGITTIAR